MKVQEDCCRHPSLREVTSRISELVGTAMQTSIHVEVCCMWTSVLVLAGIELVFFLLAAAVLCVGLSMRIMLIPL